MWNAHEWKLIAGISSRLLYGLQQPQYDAAINFLNKLLHQTKVLTHRTQLNGGAVSYRAEGILQLSADCEGGDRYSWYGELAEADEALFEKLRIEVQILPALPG